MKRFRSRSWLTPFLVVMLLISSFVPAYAETPTVSEDPMIALLQYYRIVQGDSSGNLDLDGTLTRAQAATIFVRAMGGEPYVEYFKNNVPFSDLQGHWAAGYVTMAGRLNLMRGRDESAFDPEAPITNAEVMTVILRMVEREPAGPWDAQVIMKAAAQAGFAPSGPIDLMASLPAYRGVIFKSLGTAISTIKLSDGSTVLQKHVDHTPPVLELNDMPTATVAEKVAVTGKAEGATSVSVNGISAPLSGTTFSLEVGLALGRNEIQVVAKDPAGNTATAAATVVRGGEFGSIKVEGPSQVTAGETARITATAYDNQGRALPGAPITATVTGSVGTYSIESGLFTASATAGTGKIVFAVGGVTEEYEIAVLGLAAEATGLEIATPGTSITQNKTAKVEVRVVDQAGTLVAHDQGRSIKLEASGLEGVTITPSIAKTIAGVATFTVVGSVEGEVTLTASSSDLSDAVKDLVIATDVRVVLSAIPVTAQADGSTPVAIRATLHDADGKAITNTSGEDIHVQISADSDDSVVTSGGLVIRRFLDSSSGNDAQIVPGFVTENVKVTGTIRSSHSYTVVPTTVSFNEVQIGAASTLMITGGGGTYNPATADPITLTVRVADSSGNLITDGSYAFQVEVSTSNGEELENGLPKGLSLFLGDTGYVPVVGAEDVVVARTEDGTAELTLDYDKSGQVFVKIVGVSSTDEAYNDEGDLDEASSTKQFKAEERTVDYAGAPDHLRVVVDLPGSKLTDQADGVLPANGSAQAKVKVYVVDANDGWIPTARGTATLEHISGDGTEEDGDVTDVRVSNGMAEFTIEATRTPDTDVWKASASVLGDVEAPVGDPWDQVTIITYDAKPEQPTILGISGQSGDPYRVAINDDYMQIEIDDEAAGEYGFVKVYREGSTTIVYTSDVIDLSDAPVIRVPKSKLPETATRYQIVVNNGYGDSPKSDLWPSSSDLKVINETPLTVDITTVRFDAETGKLIAKASGVKSTGTIDPSRLYLRSPQHEDDSDWLYLDGADCDASTSSFSCDLSALALTADEFHGDVLLGTQDGWYVYASSGSSAERDEDTEDNYVSPMAYIEYAAVAFETESDGDVTGTLYLYGTNLNKGKIYLNKLRFNGDEDLALSTSTSAYVSTTNSATTTIPIPQAIAEAIYALDYAATPVELTAQIGWLRSSSGDDNLAVTEIPLYAKTNVTSISYDEETDTLTFIGDGFLGGTARPESLVIKGRRVDFTLPLDGATDQAITTDTSFKVTLTPEQADLLEAVDGDDDSEYSGKVYLMSESTLGGATPWFETENGWPALDLPEWRFRLYW